MAPRALIDQLPLATRYAHFHVDLHIHELLNVPMVSGEFFVGYKVKHAVNPPRRADSRTESTDTMSVDEVHASGPEHNELTPSIIVKESTNDEREGARTPQTTTSPQGDPPDKKPVPPPLPLRPFTPSHDNPSDAETGDFRMFPSEEITASPTSSAHSLDDLRIDTNVDENVSDDASPISVTRAKKALQTIAPESLRNVTTSSSRLQSALTSNAHRLITHQTSLEPVHAYTVKWESSVHASVRIGIGRHLMPMDSRDDEAGQLHTSNVLLTVYWRQADDAPDTKRRLGQVKLNLAEYAPAVTSPILQRSESRQYLLDKCSCNALLRVSIDMQHTESTHAYRVPRITQGIADPAAAAARTSISSPNLNGAPSSGPETSQPALNRDAEVNYGLEWHCKLPLPLMFSHSNVPREYFKDTQYRCAGPEAPDTQLSPLVHTDSQNTSQPQHMDCWLDSRAAIDELFKDVLSPPMDARSNGDDDSGSISSKSQQHGKSRMRWKRIIDSVSGSNSHTVASPRRSYSGSDVGSPRREIWPRIRSDQSKKGMPSLHMHVKGSGSSAGSDADDFPPISP